VRIGVATGLVVVGDLVGSGEAQERGVVGETPRRKAVIMSIHLNSDGSQTDDVKVEPWGKFVSHQLGLSVAAVAHITVPPGCNQAVVQGVRRLHQTLERTRPDRRKG
jgi:hypothetical protein